MRIRSILTGNNFYTGLTTISAGTLQIGNGGSAGNVAGNILDNAALVFNRLGNLTYDGAISGSGSMTQGGTGTLILAGDSAYTGGTTVSAGTLQIGNGGTTGSVAGDIVNNAALVFNRSDIITYSGAISGSGNVTQRGAGILVLTGDNTYAGGTSISSGALQIGDGGTTGSVTGNILNNAILAFNHSDDITFGGVIAGAGGMIKLGAGTLTLTADNLFTGTTTISAGTLQLGNGGTTGGVSGNIVNDGAGLQSQRRRDLLQSHFRQRHAHQARRGRPHAYGRQHIHRSYHHQCRHSGNRQW